MANPNPVKPGQPAEHPEAVASVQHDGGEAHAEPAAFGFTAPMFISLAMLVIIALLIWKKVPAAIGKSLDAKIGVIRQQLAEAESLRKDAEALKAEYLAKTKAANQEAASILDRARHEAEAIVVVADAAEAQP